ncbi:MAG: MjaI family restriction endonuclease [Bacteroidetes bacterium]|nr:MjaI family restriction endonuclease [Bacteroidota bacterium]
MKRYSLEFGKKEKVLNYTCQTYQLSRPNKVGAVMSLIRQCQPSNFGEWQAWYFENAHTDGKHPVKISKEHLEELGERLYVKIKEIVIPEWTEAFNQLTIDDCVDYIFNLTINRTYDGFLREKSVINDNLAKVFSKVKFVESDPELDHAGDIDFIGWVTDEKAFGIQIKPVTSRSNFGNYSASERMKASFEDFYQKFGGNVYIVYSLDDKIANEEVVEQIRIEIERLLA